MERKSIGRIAYEAGYNKPFLLVYPWITLHHDCRDHWNKIAKSVERAVLRRLKEGKKK